MQIHISECDPSWPDQFQTIKLDLELVLASVPYISIEHVGSTSIPGLCAKPILDIDIIVAHSQFQPVIDALTADGTYDHVGDMGVPGRHRIQHRDPKIAPARNVYVCVEGCQSLRNHLAVRDVCRADDHVRDMYGKLKRELSNRDWESVDEYCMAKTEVLVEILIRAGFEREEVRQIAAVNGVVV